MTGFVMPRAKWRVTLDGRDLTAEMDPRLISLSISEKRGGEADQIDILLSDADGLLEIPKEGAKLSVELGWAQGTGLPTGLIDKGQFRIDEPGWSGPPDVVTLRGRSADFTDAFRVRRERSFVGKMVKQVVSAIASDNGLSPSIDAGLGARAIPALGFSAKSDAALLAELGRRFDAAATVKAGTLIFAPIGAGKTASGKSLPTFAISRGDTAGRAEYRRIQREAYDGAEAAWHDKGSAERKTVKAGGSGKGKPKRLRKVYASEADAKQAAEAEASRGKRAVATIMIDMAYGRPDIFPECPVSLSGFKAEINAAKWIVAECTHSMDGAGALVTNLKLEATG